MAKIIYEIECTVCEVESEVSIDEVQEEMPAYCPMCGTTIDSDAVGY